MQVEVIDETIYVEANIKQVAQPALFRRKITVRKRAKIRIPILKGAL